MKVLKLYNLDVKKFLLFFLMSFFLNQEIIYSHSLKEQNEIEKLIENWIKKNPDKIRYALKMLKAREEKEQKEEKILLLSDNSLDPFFGNPNADITIYEFFDYNCGYCKSVLPILLKVVEKDKNIKLVFKELPILSETSLEAAIYALAAHNQNLYFEFHKKIMEYRGRLNDSVFVEVANSIGLDIEKLKNDLNDNDIRLAIEKNRLIAKGLYINGTPTLIIGDKIIPGAINQQQLNEVIKEVRNFNS